MMTLPRVVPSWDDHFLRLAADVSRRSKDPSTQHGAVIVDASHRIIGTGCNGGLRGVPDNALDWSKPGKYLWVIHAEENALWMTRQLDLAGCTLYVTGPCCCRCTARIIHYGIRRIVHGGVKSSMIDEADAGAASVLAGLAGLVITEKELS